MYSQLHAGRRRYSGRWRDDRRWRVRLEGQACVANDGRLLHLVLSDLLPQRRYVRLLQDSPICPNSSGDVCNRLFTSEDDTVADKAKYFPVAATFNQLLMPCACIAWDVVLHCCWA
ncbi:hypothetical protein GY45DRAFT_547146 [Cubamyces sp. BRFM 1775]|nr:hypothetical protein GY45DRAFT_547146 [Cubamyces sp. BRFM 1775]